MMNSNAMSESAVWKPLEGVKVADFSALFPGPFATTVLADLGADVVKIEPPTGDPARTMLPELFTSTARNKRSVTLDLKSADSREHVARISAWADVVIEGFRPGVANKLGIGYEQLLTFNSRLIYCSLSGFGQDGPWRDRPGHDLNYLAAGGALAFSAMYGRRPGRSSLPLGDICGGSLAANSILAALWARERTNSPAYLDLSVFESTLYCATLRHGSTEPDDVSTFPGNDIYETSDGALITLALVEEHFWKAFSELLAKDQPRLLDARFSTMHGRKQHGAELAPMLEQLLHSRSAKEWTDLLAGSDIPFEPCVSPAQALRSEHVHARGRVARVGADAFVPFPVTVNGQLRAGVHSAAPLLGEHTTSFLASLHDGAADPILDN